MNMRPLQGIKVLDLSWVYAGPFGTLILNDLGAEVVKLETPGIGDYTRYFPPLRNDWSGYFYMLNRGKKSITLNLKSEEGKKIFFDLIKHFDVVTENFVPGTLDRLGVGYETAKEVNPGIIYASISGFGSNGPYSKLPCIDPVAQAMGGLMSQTGYPGQPPLKTGPAVADSLAGMNMVIGILAALRVRDQTGSGQHIDVSMMDGVFAVLEESVIRASMTGNPLPARGNTDPLGAPWDAFPTKDNKWVMVCAANEDHFVKVFNAIGRPDIVKLYKGDSEAVSQDLEKINGAFAEWAITVSAEELMKFIVDLRIPAGIVKDVNDLLNDPQILARDMVVDIDHPKLGAFKTFNLPIKFLGSEAGVKAGEKPIDPVIGEHTGEILSGLLGMDQATITRLKDERII